MPIRFFFSCSLILTAVFCSKIAEANTSAGQPGNSPNNASISHPVGEDPSVLVLSRTLGAGSIWTDRTTTRVTQTKVSTEVNFDFTYTGLWTVEADQGVRGIETFQRGTAPLETGNVLYPVNIGGWSYYDADNDLLGMAEILNMRRRIRLNGSFQSITNFDDQGFPGAPVVTGSLHVQDENGQRTDPEGALETSANWDLSTDRIFTGPDAVQRFYQGPAGDNGSLIGGLSLGAGYTRLGGVYLGYNSNETTSTTVNTPVTTTKPARENVVTWDGQHPFAGDRDQFADVTPATAQLSSPTPTTKAFQKVQYKFVLTPKSPAQINWVEIFTPKDTSQPPSYVFQSWTPQASDTESPMYTIDPLAIDSSDTNLVKRSPSQDGGWEIVVLDVNFVDRDNPINGWSSARKLNNEKLYAGTESGDMVAWTLPLISDATYTWQASGPGGLIITGPSGTGKNKWNIANGDDDLAHDWLDWKPGLYAITCVVQTGNSSQSVTFNQEIGWRTERYLVVGQIRPINDFQPSVEQQSMLKADLISDLTPPLTPGTVEDGLELMPLDSVMLTWFAYNSISPRRLPSLPNTDENLRVWMVQTMLNENPDLVELSAILSAGDTSLHDLLVQESYRMVSAFQVKYQINASGKIDEVVQVAGNLSRTGPTKISLNSSIVSILGTMGYQQNGPQLIIPSSPNPNTGSVNIDQDSHRISLYTSARVGSEGQYPNWALFKRDVPYIFTEIIFGLDGNGRDNQNAIRLSVDKIWSQTGPESGERYFNEIRIYRRRPDQEGAPFNTEAVYSIGDGAQQLRSFLFSVPEGQWPTQVAVPAVSNTQ